MSSVQKSIGRSTYLMATIYGGLFLLTLWAAYTGNLPLGALNRIPYYDKAGHVILYCIATYLGHRVLQLRHLRRWSVTLPVFPALFGLFTLTEELLQFLSPNRTLDALDLVCSFIGVGLGYWLAERHRQPR
ncbi:MAG: VanZ family protein [Cyanobacteria bacterium J06632_22]